MEETFEQVYAACGEMLYRLAALYLGSAGEAEDVLQDVFVKLLSRRRTFQNEEHRKRWLIRVTVNLCKDHLRSARRQKTVPLEERDLVGREEDREILSWFSVCRRFTGQRSISTTMRATRWKRSEKSLGSVSVR